MGRERFARGTPASGKGGNRRVHARQPDLFNDRTAEAPDQSGVQRTVDIPSNPAPRKREVDTSEERPEHQTHYRGEPPVIGHPAEAQLYLNEKGITFSRQGNLLMASPVELIDDFDKELIKYYKPEILLTLWCNEVFS